MAIRRYDFKCGEAHITEQFVDSETRTITCTECGAEAKRLISPVPSKLDGSSGDFPGETIKWAKRHEKAANK